MKRLPLFLIFALAFQAGSLSANDNALKLTDEIAGNILIGEMNCISCHEGNSKFINTKQAPILNNCDSRLQREFIEKFLLFPQQTRPGTTMPNVLEKLNEKEERAAANALAAYLVQNSQSEEKAAEEKSILKGKELFNTIGCLACHTMEKESSSAEKSLQNLSQKYLRKGLADFLFQPHAIRPSGRMPDMKLTREEAENLAAYLVPEESPASEKIEDQELIALGKKYFDELMCANCHTKDGHKKSPSSLNLDKINNPSCQQIKYDLNDNQEKQIKAALNSKNNLSNEQKISQIMAENRCYNCHSRDGIGGPGAKEKIFTSTEMELGDAGRLPPDLSLLGAKLQRNWLNKVLFNGETVRKYMITRMPQFGKNNLAHFVELVYQTDKVPSSPIQNILSEEKHNTHRKAGWKLIGTEGLSCISCHNYNGHHSLGLKAMDIINTYERLNPDWFYHYMINPAAYRPGIIMPSFWPGGHASQKEILNGNTDEQLNAIWHYFSLGQSQELPKGLKIEPNILKVKNEVSVYRGRSQIAGYRGIAIGFPEGLNMSFDAELLNFTAFWSGNFVNVNWQGQASGNFNPAEKPTIFNSSIPFVIENIDSFKEWPQRAAIPEKERLNPDPLFAQRNGLQFKGYEIDAKKVTFFYTFKEIEISDAITAQGAKEVLRTLSFKSKNEVNILFRIANSPNLKEISPNRFSIGEVLEIETALNPKILDKNLILPLPLNKEANEVKLIYRNMK